VVIADSEAPRDGKFIENIGFYNPRTTPPTIEIKNDRAVYWLSQGAQPSDAALRLLKKSGAMNEFAVLKGEAPVEEAVEEVVATVEEETAVDEAEEAVAEAAVAEEEAAEEAAAEVEEEAVEETVEEESVEEEAQEAEAE
jgi:small subunit ribosomal protein S16